MHFHGLIQWIMFGICYNYIYKHSVWPEYRLTNVGASHPLQHPVPPFFLMMPTLSWSVTIIPYYALHALFGLQWPSCPSSPPPPTLHNFLLIPWHLDQMSSPSGSLPWFSHTTFLDLNIYLFPTILQRDRTPNVVNSKLSTWQSWKACGVLEWNSYFLQQGN